MGALLGSALRTWYDPARMDIPRILLSLLVMLIAFVFHELAHAIVAYRLGDNTARDQGRLTLNPIPHIDPWMSVIIPLLLLLSSGGSFCIGAAKPTPVNPYNFRNPGFGMLLTSAAGPVSNFLMALIWFGILFLLYRVAPSTLYDRAAGQLTYNGLFFALSIFLNVLLGVLNFIPLPGLDGSRILRYFLPEGGKRTLDRLEPYSLLIFLGFVFLGVFSLILGPFYAVTALLLRAAFDESFFRILVSGLRGS